MREEFVKPWNRAVELYWRVRRSQAPAFLAVVAVAVALAQVHYGVGIGRMGEGIAYVQFGSWAVMFEIPVLLARLLLALVWGIF